MLELCRYEMQSLAVLVLYTRQLQKCSFLCAISHICAFMKKIFVLQLIYRHKSKKITLYMLIYVI